MKLSDVPGSQPDGYLVRFPFYVVAERDAHIVFAGSENPDWFVEDVYEFGKYETFFLLSCLVQNHSRPLTPNHLYSKPDPLIWYIDRHYANIRDCVVFFLLKLCHGNSIWSSFKSASIANWRREKLQLAHFSIKSMHLGENPLKCCSKDIGYSIAAISSSQYCHMWLIICWFSAI